MYVQCNVKHTTIGYALKYVGVQNINCQTARALKVKVLNAVNSEMLPVLGLLKRAILGPPLFTQYFATIKSSTKHILPLVSSTVHAQIINKRE